MFNLEQPTPSKRPIPHPTHTAPLTQVSHKHLYRTLCRIAHMFLMETISDAAQQTRKPADCESVCKTTETCA